MSTLNNPTVEITTEDQAKQLLLKMVLEPTKKVAQSDLRQTGVDIDMLEKTYEQGIRPYLDYLQGYRPLLDLDPLRGHRNAERWDSAERKTRIPYPESWEALLLRTGVDDSGVHAVNVVNVRLYAFGELHEEAKDVYRDLRIFLTRHGRWVVWTAVSRQKTYLVNNEILRQHTTPREMWEAMHEWGVEDYSLEPEYYIYGRAPETIPLYIESQLRRILEETIDIRRGRLEKLESALGAAKERFAHVEMRR